MYIYIYKDLRTVVISVSYNYITRMLFLEKSPMIVLINAISVRKL